MKSEGFFRKERSRLSNNLWLNLQAEMLFFCHFIQSATREKIQ
jgi:hypothetical protein